MDIAKTEHYGEKDPGVERQRVLGNINFKVDVTKGKIRSKTSFQLAGKIEVPGFGVRDFAIGFIDEYLAVLTTTFDRAGWLILKEFEKIYGTNIICHRELKLNTLNVAFYFVLNEELIQKKKAEVMANKDFELVEPPKDL